MDKPFSLLLFPFILGICFTYFFEFSVSLPIFLMILILFYLLYNIINGGLNQRIFFLIFFCLAIFLTLVADSSDLKGFIDEDHHIEGLVDQVIFKDDERARYVIKVEKLDNFSIKGEKIVLTVINREKTSLGDEELGSKVSKLDMGDRIAFKGQLRIPDENTNPKLYNYRLALKGDKIHTRTSIRDYQLKILDGEGRSFKYRLKSSFTSHIEGLFARYLSPEGADLMTSIILGKSSYLNENFLSLYRDMGLAHILAVSGLHIGIISGFIFFLLVNLGVRRRTNIIVTLAFIWVYGFIIDFPPSILRANLMFTVLYYSQLIHEPYDSVNSLSFAGLILLVMNPFYLFNIGFQLSFMASWSILVLYPRLVSAFYPYRNRLADSLAAILAVQLGLFPIQAYYFNRISLLTVLANIVMVPLLSLGLILGLIVIIFSYSLNLLNALLGPILNLVLNLQFRLLDLLASLPLNIVKVFSPDLAAIIFYYILLILIFKIVDISSLNYRFGKFMLVFLALVIFFNIFSFFNEDFLELHFIDVGQGDSLLIRTGEGDYLMDTGGSFLSSFDIGKNITLPYLEKNGVRNLQAVFISHFHEDHSQGLLALLDNVGIERIIASYYPKEEMAREIEVREIPLHILTAGNRLRLGKDLSMDIVWPKKESEGFYNENNMSLVALLTYRNFKLLLTGDLEKEVEVQLSPSLARIHMLKVPHHGSPTSSSEELLQSLRPKYGIIPVGRNNLYGHPGEDVLSRYKDVGTEIYRSDENGLILVRTDGNSLDIKAFLEKGEKRSLGLEEFIDIYLFELIFYILILLLSYIFIRIGNRGGCRNEL